MKSLKVSLLLSALLVSGCMHSLPTEGNAKGIVLTVDKKSYVSGDEFIVTLRNLGNTPVFLESCNPFLLAVKSEMNWVQLGIFRCAIEGPMIKIDPGNSHQLRFNADHSAFRGTLKFVALVYIACLEGQPRSGAQCGAVRTAYSKEFRN